MTAWDALATQMGKPMDEVAVEWSDVSVHQAVHADPDSTVTLSVLLDRSHRFQVPFLSSSRIAMSWISACMPGHIMGKHKIGARR